MSENNQGTVEATLDYIENFQKQKISDIVIGMTTSQKSKLLLKQSLK
jgi:hypothetical protein